MNHKTKLQRAIRRLVRAEVNWNNKDLRYLYNDEVDRIVKELKLARKAVRTAIVSLMLDTYLNDRKP